METELDYVISGWYSAMDQTRDAIFLPASNDLSEESVENELYVDLGYLKKAGGAAYEKTERFLKLDAAFEAIFNVMSRRHPESYCGRTPEMLMSKVKVSYVIDYVRIRDGITSDPEILREYKSILDKKISLV